MYMIVYAYNSHNMYIYMYIQLYTYTYDSRSVPDFCKLTSKAYKVERIYMYCIYMDASLHTQVSPSPVIVEAVLHLNVTLLICPRQYFGLLPWGQIYNHVGNLWFPLQKMVYGHGGCPHPY